jgi:hypothetical protein
MVCTRPFAALADGQARGLGFSHPPLVILEHPVAGLSQNEADSRVTDALDQLGALVEVMTGGPKGQHEGSSPVSKLQLVESFVPDGDEEFLEYLTVRNLSDGFPVIHPTPTRVADMLAGLKGRSKGKLGKMPPQYGDVTPELLAACAVMAGCRPDYMPVIHAITQAILDPAFNLAAIQTTTHPCAPLAIVSGPITAEIAMNCATNAFGAGNRANATIGRAIRLSLLMIGGGYPGIGDLSTMGSPAKYSYVVAENVAASPWGSLAASRGLSEGVNAVTVLGAEAPHNINDHESDTAIGVLEMVTGSMRTAGMNNNYYDSDLLIILGPEHAAVISRDGFSRPDVQRYVCDHAQTPLEFFSDANIERRLRTKFPQLSSMTAIPAVRNPDRVLLAIVGGPGRHSMFVPSFGATHAVTVPIDSSA